MLVVVSEGGNALDVLAERYRAAYEKMQGGQEQWIDGALELGAVLLDARDEISGDREFGGWIVRHQLQHLHPNERRGLAGIAEMEYKKPGTGRKLLEANIGLTIRTIWEKKEKSPQASSTSPGRGRLQRDSGHGRRTRIPTVMQDNPPPVRKAVILKGLTREQVDPDFVGTPLEFTTKYGHVNLHTKEQIEHNKCQDVLMAWIGALTDHARTASALTALASVDPVTLREWMAKPAKAEKFRAWVNSVQRAHEKLCAAVQEAQLEEKLR